MADNTKPVKRVETDFPRLRALSKSQNAAEDSNNINRHRVEGSVGKIVEMLLAGSHTPPESRRSPQFLRDIFEVDIKRCSSQPTLTHKLRNSSAMDMENASQTGDCESTPKPTESTNSFASVDADDIIYRAEKEREMLLVLLLEQFCLSHGYPPEEFRRLCQRLHELTLLSSTAFLDDMDEYRETCQACVRNILYSGTETNDISEKIASALERPSHFAAVDGNRGRFSREFELLGKLGRGGFGSVYLASNRMDGHQYAIKRILYNVGDNQGTSKRLDGSLEALQSIAGKEVSSLASLDCPYIVRYYQAWIEPFEDHDEDLFDGCLEVQRRGSEGCQEEQSGEIKFPSSFSESLEFTENENFEGGNSTDVSTSVSPHPKHTVVLYIQMEYCGQRTLREWIGNCNKASMELSVHRKSQAVRYLRQILVGLDHMYTQGIVHSDLSPNNIFLSQSTISSDHEVSLSNSAQSSVSSQLFEQAAIGLRSESVSQGECSSSYHSTSHWGTSEIFQAGGSPSRPSVAKIGDFGLSSHVSDEVGQSQSSQSSHGERNGTAAYLDKSSTVPSHSDDIFALGIIFLEMVYPVSTSMERAVIIDRLKSSQEVPLPLVEVYPEIASLVQAMTSKISMYRPNARDILNIPWLQLGSPLPTALQSGDLGHPPTSLPLSGSPISSAKDSRGQHHSFPSLSVSWGPPATAPDDDLLLSPRLPLLPAHWYTDTSTLSEKIDSVGTSSCYPQVSDPHDLLDALRTKDAQIQEQQKLIESLRLKIRDHEKVAD